MEVIVKSGSQFDSLDTEEERTSNLTLEGFQGEKRAQKDGIYITLGFISQLYKIIPSGEERSVRRRETRGSP